MTVQCKVCGEPFLCLSEMPRDTCNACFYLMRRARELVLGSRLDVRDTQEDSSDNGPQET
jgi:hypothetical protein